MKKEYRVKDVNGLGEKFQAQIKYGWWPFWYDIFSYAVSHNVAWNEIDEQKRLDSAKGPKYEYERPNPNKNNNI